MEGEDTHMQMETRWHCIRSLEKAHRISALVRVSATEDQHIHSIHFEATSCSYLAVGSA